MVKLGNFLFHYRNFLFPLFYICLFLPAPPLFANYWTAIGAGLLVVLLGQVIRGMTIGLDYIIRGGRDRRVYAEDLVTTGIFSHCRNPLYVGNLLVLLGLGIASNSVYFVGILMPLFMFFYQAIVLAEENFLRNKFGSGYDDYTKDVNRWWISWKGMGETLGNASFKWKRFILKEYNSTYTWMIGILALVAKHQYTADPAILEQNHLPYLITLLIITFVYLFIKFLKKTKRLVSN
ncbi:MAG: isoprenylcysteine carboxylmethyltransferase family protein [Chitinophagales bacterium]